MKTRILFQGDSITDCGRNREFDPLMGSGFPTIAGAKLSFEAPGKYEIINRGISGNRIVDLYARWRADAINLNPDILCLLIGVNDVAHDTNGLLNGVEADRFETVYDLLLSYTKEKLPDIKIVILEPFILKAPETEKDWDYYQKEVPLRAEAAKRVAEKHGATFIPLQKDLDEAAALSTATDWLRDGVHPTLAGHHLIAEKVCQAIKSL